MKDFFGQLNIDLFINMPKNWSTLFIRQNSNRVGTCVGGGGGKEGWKFHVLPLYILNRERDRKKEREKEKWREREREIWGLSAFLWFIEFIDQALAQIFFKEREVDRDFCTVTFVTIKCPY